MYVSYGIKAGRNKISKTLLIINHVQDRYLNPSDSDDVALRQKILDFVEEARPHVDNIAWAYARVEDSNGLPFNLENERPKEYQEGDITLTNNNGKGKDNGFLSDIYKVSPNHIILVGVYFEACSSDTAITIKEGLDVHVSVPMDMTNPAEHPFGGFYEDRKQDLHDMDIDVTTPSQALLNRSLRPQVQLTLISNPNMSNFLEPETP